MFYAFLIVVVMLYLNLNNISNTVFYAIIFALGFSVGFWAIFVTMAAEQFGTNLRATTATTVPNFVRGSLVLVALVFDYFYKATGLVGAVYVVTAIIMLISFWSLSNLKETFGKELDYLEGDDLIP